MKNLLTPWLLAICMIFFAATAQGQINHVPNGNFEYYTQCPTAWSQITRCTGWIDFTPSSDYYNCTHSAPGKTAHNGTGYAGSSPMYGNPSTGSSERIGRAIIPLTPGIVYEVSLSVMLAQNTRYATNNIGVFFYDAGYPSGVPTPQATFLPYGIIYDSVNWKRITTTFIADSAYDNIVIGGFYNSSTFAIDTISGVGNTFAYYIYDSIVVKIFDTFSVTVTDSLLCAGDTLPVKYSVPTDYNSNNIFTAQLSNKTGSFANPINIGSLASDTSGTITGVIPNTISPGTGYRIRVISSSPADTSHNSQSIKIGNPDSTNISVSSNSPLCEGFTLQFSASTFVSGTSYSWTGPNSFSSTSPNPFINGATPLQNGNYFVTMKWYGCEVTDTTQVTVKPLPAKPVANSNSPLCAGETLNLTATTSTSGVTYSWAGPGSFTSSAQNPSVTNSTVSMSGDYIVTTDLNGCNRKDTITVTVNPVPPPVTLSSTPSPSGCTGDTLYLNSTASSTGVSYTWAGPNSFSATTQNASIPNASPAATGWYKMTVGLNSCFYTDSIYTAINPIPATPVAGYNNPLCIGETLNLSASTVGGATYTWNGPGNFNTSTQNPSRSNSSFSDTGTYTVTATVSGCTSPAASLKVNINAVPFVVIFPTPADSICQGDAVTFTALPNNAGGTPQYRWVVNGQTVGTNSTSFNTSLLNDQDIVRCDMTENTKCSSPYTDQSNDITMNVLPWLAPSVTISASPNRPLNVDEYVTFTATPTNAGNNPKYQWKRNGQDVQGATGKIWSANTLNDNDSISVEIISGYKCPQPFTASSNGIRIRVLTSVNGIGEINGLALYPNPNNGKFILKGTSLPNEPFSLTVFNIMGQTVMHNVVKVESGELYTEFNLADKPAGTYLLRITGNKGYSGHLKFTIE